VKKLLFISLALVLVVGLGLAAGGCGEVTPTIVIGASRPLTGWMAVISDGAFRPIYETYVAELNKVGGITVDGTKFEVELDIRNDNSDMDEMVSNTEDLIDDIADGDVHFLFGPGSTAFLEAQAPICAEAHVVQMTAEGGATTLIPELDEYDYSFINLSFSDWYQLPILAKMLADEGATTAYVAWINDAHGLEYLGAADEYFGAEGISLAGNYSLAAPPAVIDAAPVILAANATGADVFCCFAYPDQNIPITGAAIGMNYTPNAFVMGPTANFGWYAPTFDWAVNGVTCFATANEKTSDEMEDLFDLIEIEYEYGFGFLDWWGFPCYWAAMEIWQTCVEEVGSVDVDGNFVIDQDDYRDYLCTNNFTTVFGATWYVDGHDLTWPVPDGTGALMNYECHTGEIGQWQENYVEIVGYDGIEGDFPNYVVTDNFIYPKGAWVETPPA